VVKSCRKGCPTANVLLEAKAATLHPKTVPELTIQAIYKKGGWARRGKEVQAIGLATDRPKIDRQVENRPMGADT
jgi:hypothetical protein